MSPRHVSQQEYDARQQELVNTAQQLVVAARDQLAFIRTVRDAVLRKQLVENEKHVYNLIKTLCGLTLKTSRVVVKRDVSPQMKSGFAKQKPISGAMALFSGWAAGTLHSRNDVTRNICEYIKTHGLNRADDRRWIQPDERLGALLGTAEAVTYNHVQSVLEKICFEQ